MVNLIGFLEKTLFLNPLLNKNVPVNLTIDLSFFFWLRIQEFLILIINLELTPHDHCNSTHYNDLRFIISS